MPPRNCNLHNSLRFHKIIQCYFKFQYLQLLQVLSQRISIFKCVTYEMLSLAAKPRNRANASSPKVISCSHSLMPSGNRVIQNEVKNRAEYELTEGNHILIDSNYN